MIGKLFVSGQLLSLHLRNSDTVALRYVVDGNFTAQHMKMRRPEEDVSLSDGLAYMVEDKAYQAHVASAAENTEVSTSFKNEGASE